MIKNICIYGTGGIGGVFGGIIADKISKNKDESQKVYYIARGQHLKTIREQGLILNFPDKRKIICKPHMAVERISEIPAPDLILLCVKGYDLDEALEEISKNIVDDTIIVPLLNGVDIYQRIRLKLNNCIVLPSCVYIGAHIVKPGEVSQDSENANIISGRDPFNPDFNIDELKNFITCMGIKWDILEDSSQAVWEKYLFIASFGLITAYSGKSFGAVMEDIELKELTRKIIVEIISIADKKGVHFENDMAEKTINKAKKFPYDTKTSYQRDVESGRPENEGDLFGGTILRLGKDVGENTPVTEKIYNAILNS